MLKLLYGIVMAQSFLTYAIQDLLSNDDKTEVKYKVLERHYIHQMMNEQIEQERFYSCYHPGDWVRFLLYTRAAENFQELFLGNSSVIEQSHFNRSKETKIVVHGWLSKGHLRFGRDLRKAFIKAKDCNVISVDWPSMTMYTIARLSVDSVAEKLSEFLKFLISDVGVDPESIHLLGHSLGAHIAGIAGGSMENFRLPRITGFDPAGPLFSSNPKYRIDATDAKFVDIIHTTGHWLGYYDPIGHVDFYPNGGTPIQPGCGIEFGYCSHCRAYIFYIETLLRNESAYLASKCDSYSDFKEGKCCFNTIRMGDKVDQKARGKYFLFTGDKTPFGLDAHSIPEKCWNQSQTMF